MENTFTYCVSCTAEISASAETCPECGADQNVDRRPNSGTSAPAGWQAGRPAASPTGFAEE
jgi:hypothetical protein